MQPHYSRPGGAQWGKAGNGYVPPPTPPPHTLQSASLPFATAAAARMEDDSCHSRLCNPQHGRATRLHPSSCPPACSPGGGICWPPPPCPPLPATGVLTPGVPDPPAAPVGSTGSSGIADAVGVGPGTPGAAGKSAASCAVPSCHDRTHAARSCEHRHAWRGVAWHGMASWASTQATVMHRSSALLRGCCTCTQPQCAAQPSVQPNHWVIIEDQPQPSAPHGHCLAIGPPPPPHTHTRYIQRHHHNKCANGAHPPAPLRCPSSPPHLLRVYVLQRGERRKGGRAQAGRRRSPHRVAEHLRRAPHDALPAHAGVAEWWRGAASHCAPKPCRRARRWSSGVRGRCGVGGAAQVVRRHADRTGQWRVQSV